MLADMLILSIMWLLFSIPFFTIGASTTALFYVTTRRIANREGYLTRDFWEAFKSNFKKATTLWLIILLLVWLIWFNLNNINAVGALAIIIFPAQIILMIEIALTTVYLFPMTARFDMSIKQLFKSSFYMANRHLLTSISCLILLVAGILTFFWMPPLAMFLAPGMYAWLSSQMIMRIFKKYRPEIDKDPILEIQEIEAQMAEERRKQGYKSSFNSEVVDEATEEIETIVEALPEDEPAEVDDIWTKLRNTPVEEPDPTAPPSPAEPKPETREERRKREIDAIFDEVEAQEENEDIWARLRKEQSDEA